MVRLNGKVAGILLKLHKLKKYALRSRMLKELLKILNVDLQLNLYGNQLPLTE